MKDIRMPTPFTTSNAEEVGVGTNISYWWPRKRKTESRMKNGSELKTSNKNLMTIKNTNLQ